MIAFWQIRMCASRVTLSLMFLLTAAPAFAQQGSSPPAPAKPGEESALCKPGSLPQDVQSRLKSEFGSWKIQEPAALSPRAHERWESEKPLDCPGIAVGQFDSSKTPSYAFLLVPIKRTDRGYKFLVFSPKASQPSYETRVVEDSNHGAWANFFIHKILIRRLFDEQSRRKFQVQANEGILLVDSAENEYEADVYFGANGRYQHEPVDY
jgi:hypothetical protein